MPNRWLVSTLGASLLLGAATSAYAATPTPTSSGGPVTAASTTPAPGPSSASPRSASPTAASPSTTSPSTAEAATPTPGTPSPSTASPTPLLPPTASPKPASPTPATRPRARAAAPALVLTITAGGTPQAGRFFEDIGYYAIRGRVSGLAAGTSVSVYWYDGPAKLWRRSAVAKTSAAGAYAVNQRVGHAGVVPFRATIGGAPSTARATSSNEVKVTVANSSVTQAKPVATIDALLNPTITGKVYPARPGVEVQVQVRGADKVYRTTTRARTNAAGAYRAVLAYGNGQLRTDAVRSAYRATNRPRYEASAGAWVRRTKVLRPVITPTTAAEVAKTYRAGCPVGPSRLRTITMNYYGFDRKMHRGVMIVRTDLTGKITRAFSDALAAGYPIDKMRNPNAYGGKDTVQMEDNNTSGFNCRKVVGNPYAQSPHSYGTAIDVNAVQNPYRDRNGTWWPKKGRPYIDRSPRKPGMLVYHSHLTAKLRNGGYFWGGLWSPGRDYQHFEYHK